jgi:hypothetical protein
MCILDNATCCMACYVAHFTKCWEWRVQLIPLSLFALNTTCTSFFNFVAIRFGLSARPGMVKSINQNTNIEKGAVVILLICTYMIKNTLRNIAYKYPPIYLLFPSLARSYDMEHITQGGNSAQVLAVLNLLNFCSLTTNNYRRNCEL